MNLPSRRWVSVLAGILLGAGVVTAASGADTASGTLLYKGRSAALKYALLVTGPSDMEPGKTIRRLVVSATDIGAKLTACKTFSCTDGEVTEGMTVDFTGGPRLTQQSAI